MSPNQLGTGKGHIWYHWHWNKLRKPVVSFPQHSSDIWTLFSTFRSEWSHGMGGHREGTLEASCWLAVTVRQVTQLREWAMPTSPWRVAYGQAVVQQGLWHGERVSFTCRSVLRQLAFLLFPLQGAAGGWDAGGRAVVPLIHLLVLPLFFTQRGSFFRLQLQHWLFSALCSPVGRGYVLASFISTLLSFCLQFRPVILTAYWWRQEYRLHW